MQRISLVILAVLFGSVSVLAQSSDRIEVFGGYSLVNPDYSLVKAGATSGWNASANFKVHRMLGFVADFSGFYPSLGIRGGGSGTAVTDTFTQKSYVSLFGPQVSIQLRRITPFAHFLIGVAHLGSEKDNGMAFGNPNLKSPTALSYATGGGVDYSLTRHLALRGQVDWLHVGFTSNDDQVHLVHSGTRISTGMVFRF